MNSLTIAGIVFLCTFGGSLLGILLRRVLPEPHLNSDSKDVVKMGTGLLATLSALVVGLLIASAKSSFDAQRTGLQQLSANTILLDRSLKLYGPETKEIRELLRRTVVLVLELHWPANGSRSAGLDASELSVNGACAPGRDPGPVAADGLSESGPVASSTDRLGPGANALAPGSGGRHLDPDSVPGRAGLLAHGSLHHVRAVLALERDRCHDSVHLCIVGCRGVIFNRRIGPAFAWPHPNL